MKLPVHKQQNNGSEQTQNTNETLIDCLLINNALHSTSTSEKAGNTKSITTSYKSSYNSNNEEEEVHVSDDTHVCDAHACAR